MDISKIRQLAKLIEKEGIAELELQEGDMYLRLKRVVSRKGKKSASPESVSLVSLKEESLAPDTSDAADIIRSPLAGTFYRSNSPGAPPLVNVGDEVKKGKTLCILEAMKLMNELEAPEDCKIVEIVVDNASPVFEGQPLFRFISI